MERLIIIISLKFSILKIKKKLQNINWSLVIWWILIRTRNKKFESYLSVFLLHCSVSDVVRFNLLQVHSNFIPQFLDSFTKRAKRHLFKIFWQLKSIPNKLSFPFMFCSASVSRTDNFDLGSDKNICLYLYFLICYYVLIYYFKEFCSGKQYT